MTIKEGTPYNQSTLDRYVHLNARRAKALAIKGRANKDILNIILRLIEARAGAGDDYLMISAAEHNKLYYEIFDDKDGILGSLDRLGYDIRKLHHSFMIKW